MSDVVDDLFDYEKLVAEQTEIAEETAVDPAVTEQRTWASNIMHPEVDRYINQMIEMLQHRMDKLLETVSGAEEIGMLKGFAEIKAKMQSDQINAKGVIGDG